jgi:hypothetical protein
MVPGGSPVVLVLVLADTRLFSTNTASASTILPYNTGAGTIVLVLVLVL